MRSIGADVAGVQKCAPVVQYTIDRHIAGHVHCESETSVREEFLCWIQQWQNNNNWPKFRKVMNEQYSGCFWLTVYYIHRTGSTNCIKLHRVKHAVDAMTECCSVYYGNTGLLTTSGLTTVGARCLYHLPQHTGCTNKNCTTTLTAMMQIQTQIVQKPCRYILEFNFTDNIPIKYINIMNFYIWINVKKVKHNPEWEQSKNESKTSGNRAVFIGLPCIFLRESLHANVV